MTWRDYHASTKHTLDSVNQSAHFLDWANMPDPFRHYGGTPVLDLPADPPSPDIPMLDVLGGTLGGTSTDDASTFLSQLLFHSASISAAKRAPRTGQKYALRVNPSSGNLHPTEFHFITRGLGHWPDGLYHYRPSSHMAEQRAIGDLMNHVPGAAAPLMFVLSSIAWREAWKYGPRAYRYCLLDIGHAWQALALSAQASGCESFAVGQFPDDALANSLRLNHDEWPMLTITLRPSSSTTHQTERPETIWYGGTANRLSDEIVCYPLIDEIHAATKLTTNNDPTTIPHVSPAAAELFHLPAPASSARPFGAVTRTRRSALDFEGRHKSMSLPQLSAVLAAASTPLQSDFTETPYIQLYLYVHRVDDLRPGLYRHWPLTGDLQLIKDGDQRVVAAGLSLAQDLAGNACVAFSMIANLGRATSAYGDRGYRYAHFEAGAIGHRLYLAAETLGLRATGIGAFFDDEVHRYLQVLTADEQVIYHFAIGHPIPDTRLQA